MEDDAFDEFLQTPILGRKKDTQDDAQEKEDRDLERGNGALASTTSSPEPSYGGGRSQQLQPQMVWGYCLLEGREDLHVAEVRTIDDEEVAFFAIFDGHKGTAVAQHLQAHLFTNVLKQGSVKVDPSGATRDAYVLTDTDIRTQLSSGSSTAITAMVCNLGHLVVIANVGDSRAILSKSGKATQLSVDQGLLARAFGNQGLEEHMSAKPDEVVEFVVDSSCEFLVLGSRGLFSVFENQEVVDFVRGRGFEDPVDAAQELAKAALKRHGDYDVSCIVVSFKEGRFL